MSAKPTLAERKTPRNCLDCGRSFVPHLSARKGIYCSLICRQRGISKATASRRGDTLRHTGECKTYVKRNGRHEHRVVAEQKLGRPLRVGEIVHHLNGNVRDNRPGNLEVMTQSQHINLHRKEMLDARRH